MREGRKRVSGGIIRERGRGSEYKGLSARTHWNESRRVRERASSTFVLMYLCAHVHMKMGMHACA